MGFNFGLIVLEDQTKDKDGISRVDHPAKAKELALQIAVAWRSLCGKGPNLDKEV